MRFRGTYFLMVFFVAIAAYVYLFEIKGEAERTKVKEDERKIFLFDKDDVNSIYLKNYDNTFRLERGPSGWEIKEPIESGGDGGLINLILTSLENSKIERTVVDSAIELAVFGLDKPLISLWIGTDAADYDTLFLGSHNPTRTFVYSRLSGQRKVFMTGTILFNNTSKQLFALRDKAVLEFNKDDIVRLSLTRQDDALLFEREGERWVITEPVAARGDKGKIERVLNGLSNLKAKEVVSEDGQDLKKFGLDIPWGRVDLFSDKSNEVKSIVLGKARSNGDMYVRDTSRKPVFVIPPHVVKLVADDLEVFRDRKVLEFDINGVTGITLTYPDRTITLEKESAGKWYLYRGEEPVRQPARVSRVNKLLYDLFDLRVEEFVGEKGSSVAPYGLDDPPVRVGIVGEGKEVAALVTGRKGAEGDVNTYLYVMNQSDEWIYTVKGDLLDKIILDVDDLREKSEGDQDISDAE